MCCADRREWTWVWYMLQPWAASNIWGIRNKEIFRGRREPLIRYRDFEFLKFAGRQQDLKCDCLEPLICNDHHQPSQR